MTLVCKYFDSRVYSHDLALLDEPNWLNDNLIDFAFQYFQHEVFANCSDFLFLSPGAAFVITHENDPTILRSTVFGSGLATCKLAFVPINNNPFVESVGGNHWSLLVIDVANRAFFHFDSCGKTNSNEALNSAYQVFVALSKEQNNRMSIECFANNHFKHVDTPRQINAYDCGVHLLLCSEKVASIYWRCGQIASSAQLLEANFAKSTLVFRKKLYDQLNRNSVNT